MACHPDPLFTAEQIATLDARYMPKAGAHDCCPKCSGLRCLVASPCPDAACPLREALHLEVV
jgi:hypothetical protein